MNFSYIFHYLLGISLVFAFDDLSHLKFSTQLPIYPTDSNMTTFNLYEASNAVDRNFTTCMRSDQIGPNSPYKTVWWKVDLGGIYRIYSINILFRSYAGYEFRQRGRFAGFSLYVSTDDNGLQSSSLCYKDGPELPPLNFTTVCIKSGRYVTFYNERLDKAIYPKKYQLHNVFTELCEVMVKGCAEPGFYGNICDIPCPIHCKNNDCNIQNGTCYQCNPGWKGTTCQIKCENGWYGENCSQQCVGNCINSSICNHVTGQCDVGCDVGWIGSMCEKECSSGNFGAGCMGNCSGNCINNTQCDHINGECSGGCMDGYVGKKCENYTANNDLQVKKTNQPSLWIIGFSVSVAVNAFLIASTCTLIRHWKKSNNKRSDNADVPISLRSTSYARREVASIEPDHYQYVDLPNKEMCYQNMSFY